MEESTLFTALTDTTEPKRRLYEPEPRAQPEALLRFELAPGVDLQVRQADYARQRDLIEQLIDTARRFRERSRD